MEACSARHPEHDVPCLEGGTNHPEHLVMVPRYGPDRHAFHWPNSDYVAPPPKTVSAAKGGAQLKGIADRIADRIPTTPVDAPEIEIGVRHPETSEKMRQNRIGKSGTQKRRIYDLSLSRGEVGVTDDETEQVLGLLHQSASSARHSLMKDGWLYDTGVRRRTRSGEEAIAWVAYPGG